MPMHIETLSLISAMQALMLGAMLWVGVKAEPGFAGNSLRLRAAALVIEAVGWGTLALQAWLSPAQLLLGGNALNLLAQAMVVIGVRTARLPRCACAWLPSSEYWAGWAWVGSGWLLPTTGYACCGDR